MENDNESPDVENPWKQMWEWFKNLIIWCDKYDGGITALATVVLAGFTIALVIITYDYLQETRKQRELLYIQLENSISPDISILSPRPFSYGEIMQTDVHFKNVGGPSGKFNFKIFLTCCKNLNRILYEDTQIFPWIDMFSKISANSSPVVFMGIPKNAEYRVNIETASKLKDKRLIFVFVEISYIKPEIINWNNPTIITQSQSFWWNSQFKRWMGLGENEHKILRKLLKSKSYL